MSDIVERLRRWTHAVDAAPASDLMDEAADEIERLRCLARFHERALRNGVTAALSDEEREAVEWFANYGFSDDGVPGRMAATIRGLLERFK